MPARADTGDTTTNLDHALAYARRGWRVVPIPPGEKFPRGITAWQTEGSTDEAKITHWWTKAPDHGIGIVTGATSGLWVLDVDVADGKTGDDTLAELCDAYSPLPDTYEVITGSGGRHLYFAWPTDGQIVTNSASGRLGPGLDVRGEGGFVVAPPSLHASGNRYELEASAPTRLAAAPTWLLAMLRDPDPSHERRQAAPATAGDRPGDLYAAATSWAEILEPDGWTLHHVDPDGEHHWTRPGKERRDGTSATTGYKGSDVLKVFTSSHPHLEADATYTKLGYLAATRHGGDHAAAARALRAAGHRSDPLAGVLAPGAAPASPPPPQAAGIDPAAQEAIEEAIRGDWAPVDLTGVLTGDHKPPAPTILAVRNTMPLLYAGRTNAIFGESGAGKTWVALEAIAQVIRTGGVGVLIDLEDNEHGATSRLRAIGLTDDQLLHQFLYLRPETAWGAVAKAAVATMLDRHDPELVVIDSTGEAMAAGGIKGNDDDDVARWFVDFPKYVARRGPAVVVIDHVPKDPNAPVKYMIGSQRKTAAIDGASYRVEAVKAPSKTSDGLLKIIVAKDRNGTRSAGDIAAMCSITPDLTGGIAIDLAASDGPPIDPQGKPRLTIYMERVSRLLEDEPGLSGRDIESRCEGKGKHIRDATRTLREEGWIEQDPAARGFAYTIVKPYREADDDSASHVIPEATASPRPTASPPRPHPPGRGAEVTASPAPPPTGAGTRSRPDPQPQDHLTASPGDSVLSPPVDNYPELDPSEDIFATHESSP